MQLIVISQTHLHACFLIIISRSDFLLYERNYFLFLEKKELFFLYVQFFRERIQLILHCPGHSILFKLLLHLVVQCLGS